MKRILCYGDSNTWGHNPKTFDPILGYAERYEAHVRWPGVLQDALGKEFYVCEEGLCGRTTVFEDPTHYGWNGNQYLEVALRTCDPVDCIVFMLGTNDAKDLFHASSLVITMGMERLIHTCEDVLRQSTSKHAKIVIASPLKVVRAGDGTYWFGFSEESTQKLEELRIMYRDLAIRLGHDYFDVNEFGSADLSDGVHMDSGSHIRVGNALAEKIKKMISTT